MFIKAVKKNEPLKAALLGPAGSGKSFSSLALADYLAQGGRVAAIDTERGSLKMYADKFDFDVIEPKTFGANVFTEGIQAAEKAGYACLIIDSLSHAWMGPGGILEFKEEVQRRNRGTNDYTAWREATPEHNKLVNAMLNCRLHLIVTMRTKMEHVVEKDERTGKTTVRKIGMQPIQRDGLEYEFDVVGDMDGGTLSISKTRCDAIAGKSFRHPGAELGEILLRWCGWTVGMPVAERAVPSPEPAAPAAPAAPTGPSADATAAFAAACAANNREPKPEAEAMITHYGAGTWANITDADIAAYVATMRPAVDTAAMLREFCAENGIVVTDASAELMEKVGVLRWDDVPAAVVYEYIAGFAA